MVQLITFPNHENEKTNLEIQVSQPPQEILVRWGRSESPPVTVPTHQNERTHLEIQVSQPLQEILVRLGTWTREGQQHRRLNKQAYSPGNPGSSAAPGYPGWVAMWLILMADR